MGAMWLNRTTRAGAALGLAIGALAGSAEAGDVYTVASYPVEAEARNAVEAKRAALASGQARALRSLLKRVVPVTAYGRIPRVPPEVAADTVDSFAVQREQNSATEYIATLDFTFRKDAVRDLLRGYGVPFVDVQSDPITLIPLFDARPAPSAAAADLVGTVGGAGETSGSESFGAGGAAAGAPAVAGYDGARGLTAWRAAWGSLDLANALTPVQLAGLAPTVPREAVARLIAGDMPALRDLLNAYPVGSVVLAHAVPSANGALLNVTLVGRDSVGAFHLKRRYPIDGGDLAFSFEYAGVVGLGILEGRWKARQPAVGGVAGAGGGWSAAEAIQLVVRFAGPSDWRSIRQTIQGVSGVENFRTDALSARGAEVSLTYPGGITALSGRLANVGLRLTNQGNTWVLMR